MTAIMAYGLLCGAFYCINLLSEKDFEMVSPTIFYKQCLYLNLKLKAKAKQDDATRFTWFSAACSYQRLVDCQTHSLERMVVKLNVWKLKPILQSFVDYIVNLTKEVSQYSDRLILTIFGSGKEKKSLEGLKS